MNAATYERVTFRTGEKTSRRTVLLRNPETATFADEPCLRGVEVNRSGEDLAPAGADQRLRIIALELIVRRTPMTMNLTYAELEPAPKLEARLVETLSSVLSENHDTYVVEVRAAEKQVPADYPVQPLANLKDATDPVTCGTCGRSWDDAIATSMTPAPAARCPFETFH